LIIFVFYGLLHANSVFLFNGPVDLLVNRDTHGEGMGGTGSGDLFRINTSLVNPAMSTTINRVYFSTALSMGNIRYRDREGNSFRDDQVYLPYFNLIVPIHRRHRIGFTYHTISSGNLELEALLDTEFGRTKEEHRASFSLYNAGFFYANANDIVNIGIGLNFILGHQTQFFKQEYELDYMSSGFETDHSFRNTTFNIGLARAFDRFSAGVAYSLPVDLKGDKSYRTNTLNEVVKDAIYEYPATFTFGLTYRAHAAIHFSTDVDYQLWEDTNNFDNAVNALRVGLGVSWSGDNRSRNFFARMPLRAGVSFRNLPFEENNHRGGFEPLDHSSAYHKIYETAYHFGLSFPLRRQDSYLDFALQIFNRGDADKHRYEENGFLLTIGTQGFDIFRRPLNRKAPREIPMPDGRN